MTRPTYVKQPGSVAEQRIIAVQCRGYPVDLRIRPWGCDLLSSIEWAFADSGIRSGTVDVSGLTLGPFDYVRPALSNNADHAAYYSDTIHVVGPTRLHRGAMTFGARDGYSFFHCHALWTAPDGNLMGGHLLPDSTIVAEGEPVLTGFGIEGGAHFRSEHDPETNFTLFGPVTWPAGYAPGNDRCWAIRLRPNQDLTGALEAFCITNDITRGCIHGGVGSTIGAAFTDGRIVENFATEVYIQHGVIEPGADGRPEARLDVGLVDYTGATAEGRLARGKNPVLMTFELIIEAIA
jgi:predicted DNA-binding protein with PD1-like motif